MKEIRSNLYKKEIMNKNIRPVLLPAFFCLASLLCSCAVTTAPTESSTKTFNKTTQASSDLTSSTSPGSSGDSAAVTEDFTRVNFARVKGEAAAGRGEHLAALGAMMGVPEERSSQFCMVAKEHYDEIFPSNETTPRQALVALQRNIEANPTVLR